MTLAAFLPAAMAAASKMTSAGAAAPSELFSMPAEMSRTHGRTWLRNRRSGVNVRGAWPPEMGWMKLMLLRLRRRLMRDRRDGSWRRNADDVAYFCRHA